MPWSGLAEGLRGEALARRFSPVEFPRLGKLLAAGGPVHFDHEPTRDPFDGLFADRGDVLSRPHACMGCPVIVEGTAIGVLTFDALDPHAFARVSDDTVAMLAALAGAAIRTTLLAGALDHLAIRDQLVAEQLLREALDRVGGDLLGTSAAMVRVRHEIEILARSDLDDTGHRRDRGR